MAPMDQLSLKVMKIPVMNEASSISHYL